MSAMRGRHTHSRLCRELPSATAVVWSRMSVRLSDFQAHVPALLSHVYHATMCGLRDTWCAGAFEACSRGVHAEISSSAVARGTSYGLCDSWITPGSSDRAISLRHRLPVVLPLRGMQNLPLTQSCTRSCQSRVTHSWLTLLLRLLSLLSPATASVAAPAAFVASRTPSAFTIGFFLVVSRNAECAPINVCF